MPDLVISKKAARRYLVARQGLLAVEGGPSPWRSVLSGSEGVVEALRRLQAVQLDPVSIVAQNHELVMYNRVSDPGGDWLNSLLGDGRIFEYLANARCLLPTQRFPDFYPIMEQAWCNIRAHRQDLDSVMGSVLASIAEEGPSRSRELGNDGPVLAGVGWNPPHKTSKASRYALGLLWLAGQIMVTHREGNEKFYELTQRHLAKETLAQANKFAAPTNPEPDGEWRTPSSCPHVGGGDSPPWVPVLLRMYLDAYGLAELTDFRFGWQKHRAARRRQLVRQFREQGKIIEVQLEGVRRPYYALAEAATMLEAAEKWHAEPQLYLLSPLDNLMWSRLRLGDLWDFDYRWEIYTPVAKRQFGPYTMPILEGDALIGRIDVKNDAAEGILWVNILALEDGVDLDAARIRRLVVAVHELTRFVAATDIRVAEGGQVPEIVVRAI